MWRKGVFMVVVVLLVFVLCSFFGGAGLDYVVETCEVVVSERVVEFPYYIEGFGLVVNKSCEIPVRMNESVELCNQSILIKKYNRSVLKEEVLVCESTGEIFYEGNYVGGTDEFCKLSEEGVFCDEKLDVFGGSGDSNGDGICSSGETCRKIIIEVEL